MEAANSKAKGMKARLCEVSAESGDFANVLISGCFRYYGTNLVLNRQRNLVSLEELQLLWLSNCPD